MRRNWQIYQPLSAYDSPEARRFHLLRCCTRDSHGRELINLLVRSEAPRKALEVLGLYPNHASERAIDIGDQKK